MNALGEFQKNKSLIWTLAVTDLKLRYRNSVLGFFWTVLEPLLMLSVFYLVFSYLLKTDIENYPLFLLLGIILWNSFSRGTTMSSNCILSRGNIVLSVNFSKIVLPISSSITSFLMLSFEFLIFAVFLLVFQFVPSLTTMLLPIVIIPLFLITVGIGMILSVLNVMYRDVGYIWTVILQAGFFLTPVIYMLDILPQELQMVLFFNPLSHILTWARDFVLYGNIPQGESVAYTYIISVIILIIGIFAFRKFQYQMVDKL